MNEEQVLERIERAARENRTLLNLPGERLTSLPPDIGRLTNLRELWLSSNKLMGVPAELGQLTNLTELYLHDNELTRVPPEIGQLTNLRVLYLYSNRLTSVPAELGQLTNLTTLSLHFNRLTRVPTGLCQLTNLDALHLNDNQLTSVPAELAHLANLTELSLSNNQLTSIPAGIGRLTKLRSLTLSGNENLTTPPREIVKQGTQAILTYLRELAKGKKERYEAKLLILGDGGEGKTCVSRAIRGLKFKHQSRTPGVEVKHWTFDNPLIPGDKEKEVTLNIWDFEGQEINHQSHQFFLTEQSLYLLVINGRREFKMERAEYWLDTIRARAPQSRVILVASECEDTTPSWPLEMLKADYGDVLQGERWYFAVGCESGKGIADLAHEIKAAAASMDVMGLEWPETYAKAEETIEARSKVDAHIDKVGMYEIFRESGVSEDAFEDIAGQMAVLGMITRFGDSPDLEDFVVLNPQWLTKAISLVMENEQLEDDRGEISHERMRQIWDKDYSGLYPTFHNCMKGFELCYDMDDKRGCLVPLWFGDTRPPIPWSDIAGAKVRRVEYKLNTRAPYGLMSRFIVKTHHMIAKSAAMPMGVYWRNGVFLRTGEAEYMSEALCEFDHDNRILRIQVRAAFPQNMIEQLHGFARAVFDFFEGLQPERRYGCVKFDEEEQQCEGTHPERRILFALSRDKKEIDCERGWHVVDPKRLVYGFSTFGEAALTVRELREQLDKKPAWAEGVIQDMKTSLVWIDKTYDEVVATRQRREVLSPEIIQRAALWMRGYIGGIMNEVLDNRDFNSAPAVVSIAPVDGSKFNPTNWFEKEYELTPYCEYEGGVHKVDFSVQFTKPRVWWEKTAPNLAIAVQVLSAGVKIACAGLPLAVDPQLFDVMKNEVEFMKELAGHLKLEGPAESDISDEPGELVEMLETREILRDLRQGRGEDDKRIVRLQLAVLFEEIAPMNYEARQWGPLKRVHMPDNTYRWLCDKHAAEHKK